MKRILDKYPKKRSTLPPAYQKIFIEHHQNNRSESSISHKIEKWMHKIVAADLKQSGNKSTLEIGAGTLNQLEYENTSPYDIVEPFAELYQNSIFLDKINNLYHDIEDVSIDNNYDRITSIATFEHLTELPKIVAKTCFLLKSDGCVRVAIPNEGTFLWKLGWKLTTGILFRIKYGLKYSTMMYHEHINTAKEIEEILRYFYSDIKDASFGIHKKIALYRFFECKKPKMDRAKEYLNC